MAKAKTQNTEAKLVTVDDSLYHDLSERIFEEAEVADSDKDLKQKKDDEVFFLMGTLRDYFTDHDRIEEGEGVNWLVENKKRPYVTRRPPEAEKKEEETAEKPKSKASWFNASTIGAGLGDETSDVPGGLYEAMVSVATEAKAGKTVANHHAFDSCREAIEYAVKGYTKWKAAGFPEKAKVEEKK